MVVIPSWQDLRQKPNMLKGDAQLDQSLEKAVESRRSAEAARKARIFNTRLRVMGLDLDALNQQIKEKKQQENKEKLQSEAFGKKKKKAVMSL